MILLRQISTVLWFTRPKTPFTSFKYSRITLSGKLYRLRNPSRKYWASLSAYDSSNPTKDWGFPDIYANPDNNSDKQSTACSQSEVAHESSTGEDVSAASSKVS